MTWENAILGPGWAWSMLSMLLVIGSLLGLYRQLLAQNSANALQRMEALQSRWESARMVHARLTLALWRKHSNGLAPDYNAQVALNWVIGFFEDLFDLQAKGHLEWHEIWPTWGQALPIYWALSKPAILELRSGGSSLSFLGIEQLALRAEAFARENGDEWSVAESDIPALIESQIGRNTARLQMLRDVAAGVIPTDPVARATQRGAAPD